ncbi:type II toxin-antitoxin system VapC family toxin [Sphingomonas sp. BT-65]|uniref:type II toxin-antitoxin system VapC family toxin n=1 Tax=Sphingomonas sp. BT-65 TaxID=2989821 RepID=UPI002235D005|nr:type II toxin-antitoxin system VapC family toxin [Sphingomonas sp. BT-65]MCW4461857.1 type II toxin-antitoxin system VapC family toxin [Sphingomonas sp. BT-65]
MILADTTIWIDHLRHGDPLMAERLQSGLIFTHPFVIGEIALGSLRRREDILRALRRLPATTRARDEEVQILIERQPLYNLGIGYVDAHLLAAVRLTPGLRLWTRDRRLHGAALNLGVALPTTVH